jgi:ABC-type bacteriocin/lantibiotic exporter with double-glycine peptidase domain
MPRWTTWLLARVRPYGATGDPLAKDEPLLRFVWRVTGRHQLYIGLLAVTVAGLELAPIDLQRRIVDGAILEQNGSKLLLLGAAYLGIVVLQTALKYAMQVYQSWISESTLKRARDQLATLVARGQSRDGASGQIVNVIGAEIERVCGFVGESISQALVNATLLIAVIGYMFLVEPVIAAIGLLLLAPQILLTPYLQSRLNLLVARQLGLARRLGDEVTVQDAPTKRPPPFTTIQLLYRNRIVFFFLKFALKSTLNFASALGPLVILVAGGWMVIEGQTTIGTVVAFVSGFERLSTPIRDLIAFYRTAAQATVQHHMVAEWVAERQAEPT